VLFPVVLLLAAVGFLIAALGPGYAALAWVSVALSALAATLILRRWRRSWLQRRDTPEDESTLAEDELIVDTEAGGTSLAPASVTPASTNPDSTNPHSANADSTGEEDTDAADLLVVYELTDEVLVVDEHPRYHLARCRWPDRERAERLPVREARQLGFTPCERCRPDKALARKHRASRTTATGSS
jgi:hypothetical protein